MFFFGTTLFVSAAASVAVDVQDGFSVAEQFAFPTNMDGRRKLALGGECFSEFSYTNAADWDKLKLSNVNCESSCDATTAQSPLNYENGDFRPHENFNPSTHQLKIQWNPTPFSATKETVTSICPKVGDKGIRTESDADAQKTKLEKACSFPKAFSESTCVCGGQARWVAPSAAASMSQKYKCKNCDNMKVVLKSPDFEKETTFQVAQMHMHTPSENTINGKHSSAEIHFVHVSLDAKANEPHYLVVGIFLDVTLLEEEVSPFAKDLFTDSHGHPWVGRADLNKADWKSLWTSKSDAPLNGHFWHNKGSLTTPPCTEAVEWFVLETPLRVTYDMIAQYRKILEGHKKTPHTARPTQNKNNKSTIYYGSLKVDQDKNSVEGIPPPTDSCPARSGSLALRTTASFLLGLFALLWL